MTREEYYEFHESREELGMLSKSAKARMKHRSRPLAPWDEPDGFGERDTDDLKELEQMRDERKRRENVKV